MACILKAPVVVILITVICCYSKKLFRDCIYDIFNQNYQSLQLSHTNYYSFLDLAERITNTDTPAGRRELYKDVEEFIKKFEPKKPSGAQDEDFLRLRANCLAKLDQASTATENASEAMTMAAKAMQDFKAPKQEPQ